MKEPKREYKNDIKFQISLTEEQKQAKETILKNVITVLKGSAGSGKSTVAAQVALDCLFKKQIEKVIITRPMVVSSDEMELGILPGGINEKLSLYTAPVYDNMYRLYSKEKIETLIRESKIEVIPMSMLRGRNFSNTLLIGDEMQNCTDRALEMLLTRICNGTKVILCGDSAQIDLKDRKQSGFDYLCKHLTMIEGAAVVKLSSNHRHPIIEEIMKIYQ
jgi:phosphate starvation-inducible PhoH-like protein